MGGGTVVTDVPDEDEDEDGLPEVVAGGGGLAGFAVTVMLARASLPTESARRTTSRPAFEPAVYAPVAGSIVLPDAFDSSENV